MSCAHGNNWLACLSPLLNIERLEWEVGPLNNRDGRVEKVGLWDMAWNGEWESLPCSSI